MPPVSEFVLEEVAALRLWLVESLEGAEFGFFQLLLQGA
jgi:hypothetical protein